jgi:hypothetical protein
VQGALVMLLWFGQPEAAGDAGAVSPPPRPSLLAPLGSKPTAVPGPDYELRRGPNGDLVYDAPGFTARIARDGSVSFHDKHLTLSLLLPLPLRSRTARTTPTSRVPSLESIIRGHGQPVPPPPDLGDESSITYGSRLPIPSVTPYRPDPREACRYPDPCFFAAAGVWVSVKGEFDLTDEVMRLAGHDPYRYAKARFLAGTREMRSRLAARAHADDLRRSMADLPGRLRGIACDEQRSLAERRAILEALRAELDGETSEAREAAAAIARALADFEGVDGGIAGCSPR